MVRKRNRRLNFRILLYPIAFFVIVTVFPVVVLKWIDPPITSFMLQSKFRNDQSPRYQWVDRQKISEHFAIAAVASEDQKFPKHSGFDFVAIRSALKDRMDGKALRGASTITQQVAKNLFLWRGRTFARKGLEAYFSLLIELIWDKARILEVYLNIAEMGEGIYGVQAASRYYYNKNAWEVNLVEACQLIAILPNPTSYSLNPPSVYIRKRTQEIQLQIQQLGGFDYLLNNAAE